MKAGLKILYIVFIFVSTISFAGNNSSKKIKPVLLIPGVGGSILQVSGHAKDVWISFDSFLSSLPNVAWDKFQLPTGPFADTADNDFRRYALGKYKGGGEIVSTFSKHPLIVPYSLDPRKEPRCRFNTMAGGLCGIQYVVDFLQTPYEGPYNLALDLFTQFASFNNYSALIHYLEFNNALVPGETLFGFPYDWRQSIRQAAMLERLDKTLKLISKNGAQPVSIMSHSMGCLITKAYINAYPQNAEKYIGTWIAMGGTFQGAGGELLNIFFNGYMIGNISVCDCTSRQLAVQSPVIMEMLPHSQSFLPKLSLDINSAQKNSRIEGVDAILDLIQSAYQNHSFTFKGQKYPWPFSTQARAWATESKELLRQARIPSTIKIYAIYGDDIDTPYSGILRTKNGYQAQDLICERAGCPENSCTNSSANCSLAFTKIKGDGMVPSESAANPYGLGDFPNLWRQKARGISHQDLIKPISGMYEKYSAWLGISQR